MSKNRSSQRRPSALDLFKARAPAVPAPTNNNNDSSGAKALLRDDAPPLVLPKPPPREPTSSAFIGGYGREEGKKASAAAKFNPDRISQLSKPKYKPSATSSSTKKTSGAKYSIGRSSEESDEVIWGGAPVPPVPPETSRRLSTTASTVPTPAAASSAPASHKPISLADMLLAKKKSPSPSNPDPKPKWNHNFVEHQSLPLKNLGSINDEDDYVAPQLQGRRKSAANMTLARSLLRNKPVDKPQVKKSPSNARQSGALANFVGERKANKAFGMATATLSYFYDRNEENRTPAVPTQGKPTTMAEFLAAKKAPAAAPQKTVSLADYYRNKQESAGAKSGSGQVQVVDEDVEKQRALWAKFGMAPPSKTAYEI